MRAGRSEIAAVPLMLPYCLVLRRVGTFGFRTHPPLGYFRHSRTTYRHGAGVVSVAVYASFNLLVAKPGRTSRSGIQGCINEMPGAESAIGRGPSRIRLPGRKCRSLTFNSLSPWEFDTDHRKEAGKEHEIHCTGQRGTRFWFKSTFPKL